MLRTSIFPSRYVQGAGALGQLGAELARLGTQAACLVDSSVASLIEPALAETEGVRVHVRRQNAACTEHAIADAAAWAAQCGADIVVSFGGGKVVDIGRAAADDLRLPFACVPTIAASDASCSALAVIYDEAGRVVRDRFVRRNPDLVLLDTALIVAAPVRFFIAGIGDALATFYEADACRRSGARNLCGGVGTALAFEAARLCRARCSRMPSMPSPTASARPSRPPSTRRSKPPCCCRDSVSNRAAWRRRMRSITGWRNSTARMACCMARKWPSARLRRCSCGRARIASGVACSRSARRSACRRVWPISTSTARIARP
ncbi:iron-containing alcohol dehydrogenase [Candidatus Burkholderia verschuerenii]|uniref:iron-containing alcohol dehydrogenase n=1 Tax=Candidatus Burkholderia verschuerenii TaxID=242163 RepID=UPI0018DE3FA0